MGNYDDIINLPHHVSKNHPQMSLYQRAAQFAPFAALSGYEDAIREAQRKMEEEVRQRNASSAPNGTPTGTPVPLSARTMANKRL